MDRVGGITHQRQALVGITGRMAEAEGVDPARARQRNLTKDPADALRQRFGEGGIMEVVQTWNQRVGFAPDHRRLMA